MQPGDQRGWLAVLGTLLLCLPCLAVPLVVLGGAVAGSAVGGFVTSNLWLVVGILLLGVALAGALVAARWRSRASADACCPPIVPDGESRREEVMEVRQ